MFSKIMNPELRRLLLDERKMKPENEFKSPELLVKEAMKTAQDLLKAISDLKSLFSAIKSHLSSSEKQSLEDISSKLKQAITSITDGDFLKHSTRFIKLIPIACYEEDEIDHITEQFDPIIELSEELYKTKPLKVFQVINKLLIDIHDRINEVAYPHSTYVPPKLGGEKKS